MARLHRRFRNLKPSTISATEALFASGPWTGTDEERQSKFERWLAAASECYGVPRPTFEKVTTDALMRGTHAYTWGRITINNWSVITLMHAFRHHLQAMGAVAAEYSDCEDAQAWACSLFYTVKPRLFRKRVREGRIIGVAALDLLSSATIEARMAEMYDGDAPDIGDLTEIDVTQVNHESLRPDEDDEVSEPVPVMTNAAAPTADVVDSTWIQQRYGVSRSFVSEHAERMGGRKNHRNRWEFIADDVDAHMESLNYGPVR